MRKVEHFIDFIFSNGLLQDVAYSVSKWKYDSRDVQTIPHMILTSKYSHTIAFYQQSCFELSYTPLSESTLWRILHAIKPSHRTSLAGLDDITAMGMNGFDTLKQISERLQRKDIVASLEKSKRYLKLHYQNKFDATSERASHNPLHALSYPHNSNLQYSYSLNDEVNCKDCYDLCHSIDSLSKIATECKADEDTMYELEAAKKNIIDYLKHLIRDAQQKKAKEYAFANLKKNTAFWLRDFC